MGIVQAKSLDDFTVKNGIVVPKVKTPKISLNIVRDIIDKKVEQLHDESMKYLKVFNETNDIRSKRMYDTLQYSARKVNEIIEEIEAT